MEYRERNKKDWKRIISELFPIGVPESSTWTNLKDIVNVLKKVGSINDLNHMFYPEGGGLDLTGAARSTETGCIELHTDDLVDIIRPLKLSFERISEDNEWSYFRIETETLEPSGVYGENDDVFEEVIEIGPNQYANRSVWDQKLYQGKPLPESARVISRYFRGSFVIFRKTSLYNKVSSTYDGRHSQMTGEEFRAYIQNAATPS